MRTDLHQTITQRLLADYSFKAKSSWLQQGICPACGKKELYTHADNPWILRCGRLNHCAWEGHVKEIYTDLFEHWSNRFPSVEQHPHAAADAYLQYARGFDLKLIQGWYTQEHYYDAQRQIGSATVRFTVGDTFWERLIDQPERLSKKANFKPGSRYAGLWWKPPTLDLAKGEELWLVEGIFDAIALAHHNIAAVALLSCTNYPETALAALLSQRQHHRPRLIWALDSDQAGQKSILKSVRQARKAGWRCEAAQIPQTSKGKLDWNDCHQRARLTDEYLTEYRYHGALLIAQSALDKAQLVYQKHRQREFILDYEKRLYHFKLDVERFEAAKEAAQDLSEPAKQTQALQKAASLTEIVNCLPTALYYQANPLTDEAWYYFRIDFPNGQTIKNTFTGSQVACASEFKRRLLAIAPGAFYTGTSGQLDRYLKDQMAHIRSVKTIDFIGYHHEYDCYVWQDVAVKNGQIYRLNEEDFFDIGKLSIKTLNQSVTLNLQHEVAPSYDWLPALWQCFGAKGLVALAFWFGSLFAEQIRAEHKSFPFLEIVGEPGAGKSTLIEFLWKLLGRRDYEGFDPSKSSLAARARNFAQVSNLPVVLIEADRNEETKYRTFAWDELKTAYNGRSVRATGVKNAGNDTHEPPFRGAIVISQNTPVNASEAILQRIVSLHFDRTSQTVQTKTMAETLERMPLEQVSSFMLAALSREKLVLQKIAERTPLYEHQLQTLPALRSLRIAKNHAQLMALADALALILPLSDEQKASTQAQFTEMALQRQRAINEDHPIVQAFWEMFDYLDGGGLEPRLNHAREPNLIAVNLNHFASVAAQARQQMPELTELKAHLRTSKVRKFIEIKAVNSVLRARYEPTLPATVKCWIFQR